MQRYANLGRDSGIAGYDIGSGFIIVYFGDHWKYTYTDQSAGRTSIAEMQRLAEVGQGLNAYINIHVKHRYASKGQW